MVSELIEITTTTIIISTGLVLVIFGLREKRIWHAALFGLVMIMLGLDSFINSFFGVLSPIYPIHVFLRCGAFLIGLVLVHNLVISHDAEMKMIAREITKLEKLKTFARSEYQKGIIGDEELRKKMYDYDEKIKILTIELSEMEKDRYCPVMKWIAENLPAKHG